MRIVILGPPGLGKGRLASHIVHRLDIPHLSIGDTLRTVAQAATAAGDNVRQSLAGGELIPEAVVVAAVIEQLEQSDIKRGFLLEGFPHTVAQAVAFDEFLRAAGVALDHAIELRVDPAVLLNRLSTAPRKALDSKVPTLSGDKLESLNLHLAAY